MILDSWLWCISAYNALINLKFLINMFDKFNYIFSCFLWSVNLFKLEKVCRLWFRGDFFRKFCRLWFSTPENKISQPNGLQSIWIAVFICLKIISIYLVGCFFVSIVRIRKSLQAMILQAMILGFFLEILQAMIFDSRK